MRLVIQRVSKSNVKVDEKIVGVQYQNQLAFAFHPELDEDTRIHEKFLKLIKP